MVYVMSQKKYQDAIGHLRDRLRKCSALNKTDHGASIPTIVSRESKLGVIFTEYFRKGSSSRTVRDWRTIPAEMRL